MFKSKSDSGRNGSNIGNYVDYAIRTEFIVIAELSPLPLLKFQLLLNFSF
jgi:hypothetical protein